MDETLFDMDEPPAKVTPQAYGFAGASMAGNSVTICGGCGALVLEAGQGMHDYFHHRMEQKR